MGVLKARVGGAWIPITQGFTSAEVGIIVPPKTLAANQAIAVAAGTVDITGLTATWTAIAGHTYKTVLQVGAADQSVAAGRQTFYITDGANAFKRNEAHDANITDHSRGSCFMELIESGLSGTQTRKARFQVNAGTTTLLGEATAASYAPQLWVEDITQVQPADQSLSRIEAGSYTPVLTGMAVGAGTNVAHYTYHGEPGVGGRGMLSCNGVVTLGTGATLPTGTIKVGIPAGFQMYGNQNTFQPGLGYFVSAGVDVFQAYLAFDVNSSTQMVVYTTVGTPATAPIFPRRGNVNASTPMTWKVTDQVIWNAMLPAVRV